MEIARRHYPDDVLISEGLDPLRSLQQIRQPRPVSQQPRHNADGSLTTRNQRRLMAKAERKAAKKRKT